MNLSVDIGNTLIKIGLFDGDILVKKICGKDISFKSISMLTKHNGAVEAAIISDVSGKRKKIETALRKIPHTTFLTSKSPLPFINEYKTPATLGTDRIALVAGAIKYFPAKNVLVVSAGTCVTYDFINSKKKYKGGSISPGMQMRFEALNHFTARLPLIKPKELEDISGSTTQESILSGVVNGIAFEMDGFINEYKKKYDDVKVILTGGDADLFAKRLKNSIFAAPDLTLTGLNEILKLNVR